MRLILMLGTLALLANGIGGCAPVKAVHAGSPGVATYTEGTVTLTYLPLRGLSVGRI